MTANAILAKHPRSNRSNGARLTAPPGERVKRAKRMTEDPALKDVELQQAVDIFRQKFRHALGPAPFYPAGRILLPPDWKRLALAVPIDGAYVVEAPSVNRPVSWLDDAFARDLDKLLQRLAAVKTGFNPRSFPNSDLDGITPYFPNGFFGPMDSVVLSGMLATCKPRRYVEIGSGNSTRVARWTINEHQLATTITCIDPEPRKAIDRLADEIVPQGLLQTSTDALATLAENDILFFDGSHLAFSGTDCQRFFLEILPALPVGVYVHVHDIFLPDDYPPRITNRFYNEQQLVAAFLYGNRDFEVVLPVHYLYERGYCLEGVSFWLKRVAKF